MAGTRNPIIERDPPPIYAITIKGHLGEQWAEWFDDLTIRQMANGETVLTGPIVDQAALHGIIKKIRDLGMPLLSLRRIA